MWVWFLVIGSRIDADRAALAEASRGQRSPTGQGRGRRRRH
jgi:hypothetical protein